MDGTLGVSWRESSLGWTRMEMNNRSSEEGGSTDNALDCKGVAAPFAYALGHGTSIAPSGWPISHSVPFNPTRKSRMGMEGVEPRQAYKCRRRISNSSSHFPLFSFSPHSPHPHSHSHSHSVLTFPLSLLFFDLDQPRSIDPPQLLILLWLSTLPPSLSLSYTP